MKAESKGNGIWSVEGDTGHIYTVSLDSCSCPHFINRLKKSGGSCKHMIFIQDLQIGDTSYDDIIRFVKFNPKCKATELEKEFGIEVFDKLKSLEMKGEIIYNRRYDTYNILE